MTSSSKNSWRTPPELFKELDDEFHFDLDPCTTQDNPLQTRYFYTEQEYNGLLLDWHGNVFVNPPYGYNEKNEYLLEKWVKKAFEQITSNRNVKTIVLLVPTVTSTKWFHKYVWNNIDHEPYWDDDDRNFTTEIRFPDKRIKYLDEKGEKKQSPRFDSMIIIYKRFFDDD
ncbi:MAG: DNA N-6-adenine-methyltransferase [Nitrososphaeraceae archaeon]